MRRIDLITEAHCFAGVTAHTQHQHCTPKLWATGPVRRIVAEPAEPESANLNPTQTALLLGAMRAHINAFAIGRTVEVWMRACESTAEASTFEPGDLAALADTDPTVTTAIIAEGYDLDANTVSAHIASLELDDEGHPTWVHSGMEAHSAFINVCRSIKALDNHLDHPAASLNAMTLNTGWAVHEY